MQTSTWKEVKAISYFLSSMMKIRILYWQADNVARTSIICSGSNKVKLQNLELEIYNLRSNNNLSLNIEWIPMELSKTADLIRKSMDYDDWLVTENYFKLLNTGTCYYIYILRQKNIPKWKDFNSKTYLSYF